MVQMSAVQHQPGRHRVLFKSNSQMLHENPTELAFLASSVAAANEILRLNPADLHSEIHSFRVTIVVERQNGDLDLDSAKHGEVCMKHDLFPLPVFFGTPRGS